MLESMSGKTTHGANRVRRMMSDTAKEVAKSPEAFEVLKNPNPSLVDVVEGFEKARMEIRIWQYLQEKD
jgi:hypothetical protein